MHHPTDRITHTTAFVTPVVVHWLEREIAQWVHPMKDRSDDPSHHERTLLPRSYISLLCVLLKYLVEETSVLCDSTLPNPCYYRCYHFQADILYALWFHARHLDLQRMFGCFFYTDEIWNIFNILNVI